MQTPEPKFRRRTQRAARSHAAFLADASRLLASSLDYETTLGVVAGLALPYLGSWCLVDLVDEDGSMRRLAVIHPDPQKQELASQLERGWPPKLEDPLGVPAVIRTRQPEVVSHVPDEVLVQAAQTPENLRILRQLGIGSLIVVPLVARDHVHGAITFVSSVDGHRYTDADLELAQDVASRAALAIDNARLFGAVDLARRAAEQDRMRLQRLQELTAALSRSRTPDEVGRAAVTVGSAAFGAKGGFVGLLNPDGTMLDGIQAEGYSAEFTRRWAQIPLTMPVPIVEAVRTGEPMFLRSLQERNERFATVPGPEGFEAIAAAPLVIGGKTRGAWALHFRERRDFGAEERVFFATMTEQCAQALDRALLYSEAQAARVEAQAANQAKSVFLATTSHEIRTPINAIVGYCQLLEMGLYGSITDLQRAQLERIHASSEHLLGLVNEVLDLAKVEAGQLTVRRERAKVPDDLEAAAAISFPKMLAGSIAFANRCQDANGPFYLGDPDRVRQILINLLGNAAKFTPAGGQITVTCGVVQRPADEARLSGAGPWTVIHVDDTGPGIEPDDRERIFKPFVQGQGGLTRTQGGTGLGLAISRQLARLMGGDLTVQGGPEQGSRFSLWLPATPDAKPAAEGERRDAGRRADGFGEVGELILKESDTILDRYLESLRTDPALGAASSGSDIDLRNHALSLLTAMAQSVNLAKEHRGEVEDSLRDGSKIQRTIAELHGAQRRRLGWREDELRRDSTLLREAVEEEVISRLDGDAEEGLALVRRLFEQVEHASVRAWRLANGG